METQQEPTPCPLQLSARAWFISRPSEYSSVTLKTKPKYPVEYPNFRNAQEKLCLKTLGQ